MASCTTSADYQILSHNYSQHTLKDNMGYRHVSPHCVIFLNHYESRTNAKSLRCIIVNTNQLQVFKIQTRFVFRGLPHLLRFQNSGRKSRFDRLFTLLQFTAIVKIRLKSFSNFNASVSTPRIKKYVLNLKPSLVEVWGRRGDFFGEIPYTKIGFVIHKYRGPFLEGHKNRINLQIVLKHLKHGVLYTLSYFL